MIFDSAAINSSNGICAQDTRLLTETFEHSVKLMNKPYEHGLFNSNCEYYDTNDQQMNDNPYSQVK